MSYSSNQANSAILSGGLSSRFADGVYREASVHADGYRGSSISMSSPSAGSGHSFSSGFGGGAGYGSGSSYGASFSADRAGGGLLYGNEKYTMQNLNDRLANYLDKVRSLEEANNDLETKIRDWYTKQGSGIVREQNFAGYYTTIDELHDKIFMATMNNSEVILDIDNARLSADDFKLKYENERSLRQNMDNDINGLRRLLDELAMTRSDLEFQIEALKEELIYLKKNHKEDFSESKQQAAGTINIELDAAPGVDLLKTLNDLREQYELVAEKNRREAEAWFLGQVESLQKDAATSRQQIQTNKSESTELRRSLQELEIELQSLLSAKASLEASVAETEGRYAAQLCQMQSIISSIEGQLADLRSDIERQNQEHKALMDIKTRLEQEIATYHQLLEREGGKIASQEFISGTTTKAQTVIKEEISGAAISSTSLDKY